MARNYLHKKVSKCNILYIRIDRENCANIKIYKDRG